jgi:hypothetical protein
MFSGRSHFSNTREPGDYDDWFQVWQDFTAAIDNAAKSDRYTYVFDTDINDFFPLRSRPTIPSNQTTLPQNG